MKYLFFLFIFSCFPTSQQLDTKIRRIIIKEYPGGTLLPTKLKNETLYAELFDGRYIKAKLYDYRGKMYLRCYSKDSVLMEVGNYINSLSLLREQVVGWGAAGAKNQVIVIEFYEPLRNGKWLFYDSTGKLKDSCVYIKGIKSEK